MNGVQYAVELQIIHKIYGGNDQIAFSIFFDYRKDVDNSLFTGLKIDDIKLNTTETTTSTTSSTTSNVTTNSTNSTNTTNTTANTTTSVVTTTIPFYSVNDDDGKGLKIAIRDYMANMLQSFYYYKGSTTSPPCTEDMSWILFDQIQYMSYEQKDVFDKLWLKNKDFANGRGNNRKIQTNENPIYYKEVTMEERRETLYNRIMLPDSALI